MNSYTTLDNVWAITVNVDAPDPVRALLLIPEFVRHARCKGNRSVACTGCAR
jgi:hypothetical protein